MKRKLGWGVLSVALTMLLAGWAPNASASDFVLHGRVSYDAGGTLVRGADAGEWSHATVNTLILPGDTLWMDQGGTGEVEFSGGTFVRLADGSKAEVVALPPSGTVRAWSGSFYVHRLRRSSGSFIVETPAATVQVEESSSVRVDVVGNGATTVTVRWGRANVNTEAGGTIAVHSGRRVWVDPGLLPSEPVPFERNDEDAFDQWNRERSEYMAAGTTSSSAAQTYIKEPVLGVSDLDTYGEWVYVDSRRVWRPTVVVDYTPYRYGYWSHVPAYGHCWVGQYPFSYVTSHYGRWDYHSRYGWVWGYDPVWSPAWVTSFRYGDYYAWAPVNYRHHPVYLRDSVHFDIGGVHFSLHGTSYVQYSHLYGGPGYVYGGYHNPGLFSGINVHNGDVYIWNININTNNHVRTPYNDSVHRVRNYNPRRSVRGTTTFASSRDTASQRVRSLEGTLNRQSFSRVSRGDVRQVRTSNAPEARQANLRRASITQSAPSYTRATRQSPVVATRSGPQEVRGATVNRVRTDTTTRGGRGNVERTPAVSGRSGVSTRPQTTTSTTRTPRNTTEPQRRAIPQTSTPGGRESTVTRTPSRTTRGTATPSDRSGGRSSTPIRTYSRPDNSNRPRVTTTRPNTSVRSAAPTNTRTQSTPQVRTYSRPSTPSTSTRSTSRPSVSNTRPSYSRPSTPSPSTTRSISRPSAPSNTRSYSRPSTPRPSTTRSISRPSTSGPSSTRSISRPSSPSSSRSVSRPSSSGNSRRSGVRSVGSTNNSRSNVNRGR